jgi:hypothetical protein
MPAALSNVRRCEPRQSVGHGGGGAPADCRTSCATLRPAGGRSTARCTRCIRVVELRRHHDRRGIHRQLGSLPLAYQPGTVWDYSLAVDVNGQVVEAVSGAPAANTCERLWGPLDSTPVQCATDD